MTEHTPFPDMPLPDGLTDAERDGLRRILNAMQAEIGDEFSRSDLAWVARTAFEAAADLIRTGLPITIPDLGIFCRTQPAGDRQAPRIDYAPEPLLLEDRL
jgi:hypothetical protein